MGQCLSNTDNCRVSGYEARVGIQLNFNHTFLFFQGQYQQTNLSEPSFDSYRFTNNILSIGAGKKL